MDQREWDYGARLPRERRAAESWSLDNGPESTESDQNPPKWQSITDTGSLEPSPEALAWARRADQWAQQPNLPERQQQGQWDGQVSRWSEVVPTGNYPADGVGWRTETAEWRATSARWRQTTEWRSTSGTHGWRSTTEAWQTGDANIEGFPPPSAPPTGGTLAISGSAWSGDAADDQSASAPETWQQPDGSYRTESYQPPSAAGQQPGDSRPGWQQSAAPAPPWQQSAPAPPWQQTTPGAAPWQQTTPGAAPREQITPGAAPWEQTAPGPAAWEQRPPAGGTSWQRFVGPDDGRHLVREDDRAQWRQSAASAAGPQDREDPSRQIGRRRASDGPRPSGGTGWSTRSDADNWAGHTDTGSIPLFSSEGAGWQDPTDTPDWRTAGRAETAAPDWRSRSDTSGRRDTDEPGRRAESRPQSDASDWRTQTGTSSWRDGGSGRTADDVAIRGRADAAGRRTGNDAPATDVPSWRAEGDGPVRRTDGDAPDWRDRTDMSSWRREDDGARRRPEDDAAGRRSRRDDAEVADWRTQTSTSSWQTDDRVDTDQRGRRTDGPAEPDAPGRRRDGRAETDPRDWRTESRTDIEAPGWRRDGRADAEAPGWRGSGRADPEAPGRRGDGRADTAAPGWRDEPRADGRASTEAPGWRRDRDEYRREPDSGSWSRGEDTRADGWRRAADPETPSWRRDQEDWRREEPATDPWAHTAADTGVIPTSWQQPSTDTGSWRAPEAAPYAPARRTEPEPPYVPPRRRAAEPDERDERDERDPYGRRSEVERYDDPYGRRAEIEARPYAPPRRRAEIEEPDDDYDEDDEPRPDGPIDPDAWRLDPEPRPERRNWRMEPLDDARTQSWRRELRAGQEPLAGEAETEIRPPIDWQLTERDEASQGTAPYREGNTGDWRRELAAESDLAAGESRRYGTADFVPFKPFPEASAGAVSVPAARPAAPRQRVEDISSTGTGRWQDPPDTQWPPRPATGYDTASTGSYERRPVSTLPTAAVRQNNLLEPDEDEIEESTGGPLAAVGYTVIWYGVPVVLFVLYMLVLNGSQQAHALSSLANAAPQFGLSLVLSMLVAVALRWASGSWKAASVGLAAAVMGGGLATVLTSAITGNSLS